MSDEIKFEVGQKWSIVQGEWVRDDENGAFPVVEQDYVPETINAKKQQLYTRTHVGKSWSFRRTDCITVVAEYLDDKYGTDYYKQYMTTTGPEYRKYVLEGMTSYFEAHPDFESVTEMQVDDVLVYAMPDVYDERSNHIALYIGDGMVFRQPPFKMSSIDPIDPEMVIRIFRGKHAN